MTTTPVPNKSHLGSESKKVDETLSKYRNRTKAAAMGRTRCVAAQAEFLIGGVQVVP